LAAAYAALRQFDDAWRCIGEVITAVNVTRWWEADIHLGGGEAPSSRLRRCRESAGAF
jgi:hypothetical protein